MKITIELSEVEVKGIKAYLSDTDCEPAERRNITQFIQGIVSGTINAPQEAVSDYIKNYTK